MTLGLHTLKRTVKHTKRVGRGNASGKGGYAGRGLKGQRARSGGRRRPGFEGGRMPLIRQIPKTRGFTSRATNLAVVNVSSLNATFENDTTVTFAQLRSKKLVPVRTQGVKVLGGGSIAKKLTVEAQAFSVTAKKAIEDAGGKAIRQP